MVAVLKVVRIVLLIVMFALLPAVQPAVLKVMITLLIDMLTMVLIVRIEQNYFELQMMLAMDPDGWWIQ